MPRRPGANGFYFPMIGGVSGYLFLARENENLQPARGQASPSIKPVEELAAPVKVMDGATVTNDSHSKRPVESTGRRDKKMNLDEHQILLSNWQARCTDGTFISDGPIDPSRWSNAKPRVLFLAKEAYGEMGPGQTWDLPELVREVWREPKGNFWWNLGYWAYGIQHQLRVGEVPSSPWTGGKHWKEDVWDSVLQSAIVNLKKIHGYPESNDDDLRQYVHNHGDLLRRQVECLSPDVMVCCYTWHLVEGHVWEHAESISELVFRLDDMLVLDFWHPANRYPNVLCYYAALGLLQRAL
ncbi:MAG: hypothetical protein OXH50_00120 [Gemmatimonadetes bacterium]|nr:hypothetical protein [Gemmatimonadota bacterium]